MSIEPEASTNPFNINNSTIQNNTAEANATPLQDAFISKITKEIGSGEDAKHSIVWTTIRWSFFIPSILTLLMLIFLYISYQNNNQTEVESLRKYILAIWGIFTPLITLSLGYAFGKDIKS